jgi:hypothetical protein
LGAIALLSLEVKAQKLSGQWIGDFGDATDPRGIKTNYVLEIEMNGQQISGHSYTYFSISGKRYYVICKLKGQYEPGSKSLTVNEVETLKTNTPPDFQNCLQSHQLTYFKQKDKELLIGKWKPFEKGSTCGSGLTSLERKAIPRNEPTDKNSKQADNISSDTKNNPKENPANKNPITEKSGQNTVKTDTAPLKDKITKRSYEIIKTFDVAPTTVKIEIYDYGQIDGDTVMIFLNDKLLIPEKLLTEKPITIDLTIDGKEKVYDLIMYAKSEGTLPPNTAIMIVTINGIKEEFKISSTQHISRAIRFKLKDR